MQTTNNKNSESDIDISELSESLGQAAELHPNDRVRRSMAYLVLGGVFFLLVASGAAMLTVSVDRLERAQQLFEFVKSFALPLVTLVLGFYFREAGESKS